MATSSGRSKYGSILNCKTLTIRTAAASASSSSFRSVCLHRWWLAKPVNGQRGLAVAGFSSREGPSVRAFRSAAISKRHDATTVEAADGFRISIVGFIDEHQTHQNGFSLEVCSRFLFGFPYDWEEYVARGPTEVLSMSTKDAAKDTIKTHSRNSHHESDWFTLTVKATDDLFKCLSEMGYNESSSPEHNDKKLSKVANMHANKSRPTNSDASLLHLLYEENSVDGNSKINGDKPVQDRRITRSMTEVKTRK
uniref:SANTA domain-containing protein n=1 Tax=Kalanchoe fedtschenkoi TaxID=63787 RepID=A0A7N0V143_KALFE